MFVRNSENIKLLLLKLNLKKVFDFVSKQFYFMFKVKFILIFNFCVWDVKMLFFLNTKFYHNEWFIKNCLNIIIKIVYSKICIEKYLNEK